MLPHLELSSNPSHGCVCFFFIFYKFLCKAQYENSVETHQEEKVSKTTLGHMAFDN